MLGLKSIQPQSQADVCIEELLINIYNQVDHKKIEQFAKDNNVINLPHNQDFNPAAKGRNER